MNNMSFLARIFGRDDTQSAEKLEKKIKTIRDKSKSTFVALIGLSGKVKGLNVITSITEGCPFDETEIKRLCAKIAEAYLRFKKLDLRSKEDINLSFLHFRYYDLKSFWIFPLYPNEEFAIVAQGPSYSKIIDRLEDITEILLEFEKERRG